MPDVHVLTMKRAADRLRTYPQDIANRLALRQLTPATIDGRPAVLEDDDFRRAEAEIAEAAA